MAKGNKQATREAILEAARTVLASDGPEALSVSKVAHLAGVNRGTAYQHFKTRDDLILATVGSVSEQLCATIFDGHDNDLNDSGQQSRQRGVYEVISKLVEFAVENPNLGRIWLYELLSSKDPSKDPFFRHFQSTTQKLSESNFSQDGIDVEALSVIVLSGYFVWAEWVRAQSSSEPERQAMAERMRREMLRLFLHGVLKTESYPELQDILNAPTPDNIT